MLYHIYMLFSFRIFGKPPLAHTFTLLEHFEDCPERRERHYAENDAAIEIGNKNGQCARKQAKQKECHPALDTKIILTLDYQWVEKTYHEKGNETDYQTYERHCFNSKFIMHNS